MIISMVAAMAANRVIGKDNQMPWHLPADLKHFKQVTMGKPVVMGRKTFESIGRVLPGRRNIVISRQQPEQNQGAEWVTSLEQAFVLLQEQAEIMIIGGAQIYHQCLPLAKRLYLTKIDLETDGDAYFPDYQADHAASWQVTAESEHKADTTNPYHCRFITLQRLD
ncbi:type 3 dihydrofolate reductase [Rheinheimera baltica]|uniref:Dihydrofolate reductase n=1 Tax=Rheinheimera baltica TaxID=67576 RepID=A0ABT9I0W1_9GAMM|nr:type 3 dihydrofolate reductase [Rheinheimera baltica]MDP5136680.1 type 3 dihydrofolate reductase [Rheinheimera baltica]MDP5142514.1 type 3 dihydrofolate reductase [Rheinheimera baltica]MDP5150387.1 type 3 dihydrofolate reductase [Rheinheimera baltica]